MKLKRTNSCKNLTQSNKNNFLADPYDKSGCLDSTSTTLGTFNETSEYWRIQELKHSLGIA